MDENNPLDFDVLKSLKFFIILLPQSLQFVKKESKNKKIVYKSMLVFDTYFKIRLIKIYIKKLCLTNTSQLLKRISFLGYESIIYHQNMKCTYHYIIYILWVILNIFSVRYNIIKL